MYNIIQVGDAQPLNEQVNNRDKATCPYYFTRSYMLALKIYEELGDNAIELMLISIISNVCNSSISFVEKI